MNKPLSKNNKMIYVVFWLIYLWLFAACTPTPPATSETIILSNAQPEQHVVLEDDFLQDSTVPKRLSIPINEIDNAANIPFSIFVYLSAMPDDTTKTSEELTPERWLLGNFSIYPSDQTGVYVFGVEDVFVDVQQVMQSAEQEPDESMALVLNFELELIDMVDGATPLAVKIAPVEWE
ncbi:MAG: hypothetical protein AAF639_22810 [Chloroflexota bacterium]